MSIVLGNDPRLVIIPPVNDRLTLDRVTHASRAAFLAEKGLTLDDCPAYVYGYRAVSTCFVWVLAPMDTGGTPPAVQRLPVTLNGTDVDAHDAVAVEVTFPGYRDIFCLSHKDYDAEMAFAGITTWGFLALRRLQNHETRLAVDHLMRDGVCGR
jgi:hypothetical protein